jgi:hypothetical protein
MVVVVEDMVREGVTNGLTVIVIPGEVAVGVDAQERFEVITTVIISLLLSDPGVKVERTAP